MNVTLDIVSGSLGTRPLHLQRKGSGQAPTISVCRVVGIPATLNIHLFMEY